MRNDSQRLRALEEKVEGLLRREAEREAREAAVGVALDQMSRNLGEKLRNISQHMESDQEMLKASSARLTLLLHQ